ncbi:MAG: hypothetical protein AAF718_04635 [Pseudomonadota bacterium]
MPLDNDNQSKPRPNMKGANNPNWRDPFEVLAELRSMDFGTLRITGTEIVPGKHRQVETTCVECKTTKLRGVDNLKRGNIKTCICQRAVKNGSNLNGRYGDPRATVLGERYDAIKQRCENPRNPEYRNYGARGIKLLFGSRDEFIQWCLGNLPHEDYRGVQIDRCNNDGHYEPGNLRLVTQMENLRNKRNSVKVPYGDLMVNASDLWHLMKSDYPSFSLSPRSTARFAAKGVSWNEILEMKGRGTYKGRPQPEVSIQILKLYGKF